MTEGVHAGECVSLLSVRCTGLHKHQLIISCTCNGSQAQKAQLGPSLRWRPNFRVYASRWNSCTCWVKRAKMPRMTSCSNLESWLPETPQEACIETWALWYLNTRTHVIKGESYEWS